MHNDGSVNDGEDEIMREAFEEWVKEKAQEHGYKYMELVLRRDGDGYASTWVDSAWMGWKAALEYRHNEN